MADLTSKKDIEFLSGIIPEVGVGDRGMYQIAFHFKGGIAGDYVQGQQSWLHPRHMVGLFKEMGNMAADQRVLRLGEIDKEEMDNARIRSVRNTSTLLSEHPAIQAYLLGKKEGITAIYEGDLVVDKGMGSFERNISEEAIALAIISGAVFGGKSPKEILSLYDNLESGMRYNAPKSFNQSVVELFREGYSSDAPGDITSNPRFKLFEDRLYKSTIEEISERISSESSE